MCYKPINLKNKGVTVPCGKCPKCIARKTSAWSFRLMQQEKISQSADFITLTYDTKYIPITDSGYLNLNKHDLQCFFKRLRKLQYGNSVSDIKYYAVGEYGDQTKRPHYHCILFNAKLELINQAWNKGHIYYGKVSGASVGYTLKYMSKIRRKNGDGTDRQKEFALMSKGLGIAYLTEIMCNWHAKDLLNRMYCTTKDGVKISMPRYYKDKLYFDMEKAAIAEAYAIISNEKQLIKLSKQTSKEVQNEKKAIEAAYHRMYLKTLKNVL